MGSQRGEGLPHLGKPHLTNAEKQRAWRARQSAKMARLEAFARWTIERLSGKSGPVATEITDKANEALGGK